MRRGQWWKGNCKVLAGVSVPHQELGVRVSQLIGEALIIGGGPEKPLKLRVSSRLRQNHWYGQESQAVCTGIALVLRLPQGSSYVQGFGGGVTQEVGQWSHH